MRFFPSSNRRTWLLAGVLVVVAVAVAAYAIHELGKPGNQLNTHAAFNPTTTTTAPAKHAANNFTVPFYGNGPTRTRDFVASAKLDNPQSLKLAWKFTGNALLEFPATIWGNNLFFIDDGATVKRVNIKTGKKIWERHMGTCTGCGLSASSPALDPKLKMLFVSVLSLKGSTIGAVGGEFAGLSMGHHGKVLWTFPVPSGTESSPVIVGNSVYFGDQAGTEYSLNVKTGHENWSFPTGGPIKAGADYYEGNLYFGNYAGSFYAVNANTGKQVWTASPGGEFYSTPAAAYGRIYVGNNNGAAYSYVAKDGTLAWSRGLGSYVYSGPAVATVPKLGPTVFIGSYTGALFALNAQSGATDWSAQIGGPRPAISGSATVVNDTVYVSGVYAPGSYAYNASTGKQVWTYPDGSYTTVIANQNALFLMGKYVLYKFSKTGK
jgi:outer membrane protein assembly factor BamB